MTAGENYLLCHAQDVEQVGQGVLRRYQGPEAARDVGRYDAAGEFRPLRSAPTLAGGWEIAVESVADLHLALDFLYPAALASWLHHGRGQLEVATLRETVGRQTGMYRITGLLRDEEAEQLVQEVCAVGCLRRIVWPLSGERAWTQLPPHKMILPSAAPGEGLAIPLLCTDACPLLIGGARTLVKERMKREAPPPA